MRFFGARRSVFLKRSGASNGWPFGADGALVVDGTTVNIANGSIKDYSSFLIKNNGILNIQAGSLWTIIGCSGDFTIEAGSVLRGISGEHTTNTASTTAPDGTFLSHTITQSLGGTGGSTFEGGSFGAGDSGTGNGGGGGGDYVQDGIGPTTSLSGGGGDGHDGSPSVIPGPAGTSTYGGNGANADDAVSPGYVDPVSGPGGAGAFRGRHGQRVYWKVKGTISIAANGIDLRGQNGGAGGYGGDALGVPGNIARGGGGGGGGAGGSGGKGVGRYKSGSDPSASVLVTAGTGGSGGSGGVDFTALAEGSGDPGGDGISGTVGTKDISTY